MAIHFEETFEKKIGQEWSKLEHAKRFEYLYSYFVVRNRLMFKPSDVADRLNLTNFTFDDLVKVSRELESIAYDQNFEDYEVMPKGKIWETAELLADSKDASMFHRLFSDHVRT